MMGLDLPAPSVMANPDGTIAAADRAQLLWLYCGIPLGGITYAQTVALDIFLGHRYVIDARWSERPPHKAVIGHKGGG